MAWDAGAIVSKLTLDRSKFSAAMKQVSAQVKGFGGLIKNNSAQIKKMGRQMTMAGAAIVGGVGLMVKAYGSFNEAMVRSLAIMGDVSPAMRKEMAKTAKQLSTESTFAAKDLAEAYYFLASAGMNAEQSISALAPVARFAQAGAFDLAQATDLLTDAQTALGLSSKNVIENEKNLIRVSDVLVGANTLANASVLQFSEALTNKAAAAMVNLNIEVEEGVAVLAAYADKGVKGRLAGQRLTMMLNGLFDATRQNKKAWDDAGISLFNADESMRDIADIIQDMEGYMGNMTVKQREATLATLGFNIKTKDSILTLMGSSEKMKEWTGKLKEMGGITKEVAAKQLEAFNAKMTILKNTVIKAAIGIGQSLAPMIESIAEKIKNVAEKIAVWIEKHPKLTAVIATVVTGIGALLLVLGPLMMMLPGIIVALPALAAGFSMLLGPVGAVALAVTALGIALNKVMDQYKKKQDAEMDAMVEAGKGAAQLHAFRRELIEKEIVTVEEWGEIYRKHGKDHKRVMIAISKLPEYAHIREQWDKVKEKHKEVEESSSGLTEALRKNSEDVVKLTTTMVDEIFKATHNEFEVRVRMAQRTYEERKALLEKEKADKQAYVLLERTLAIELDAIEKDRTEKFKTGWAERGRAVMAGLLKWRAAEKKFVSFIAKYTDIIKKHTLSEISYKLYQLDVWYDTEIQTLSDLYGKTEKFYTALEVLDKAYEEKKKGILAEGKKAWENTFGEILGAAAMFTSALSGLFNQMTENQMMNIENEYEARKAAIENSMMTEKSKADAMAKLDKETDKKRKKAMIASAKKTKAVSLMEAIVNTAAAVVQAMKAPFPLSLILPIIIGAMGAAQIALIAAQPLPTLAKGGRIEEAGIVGEKGPELFVPGTPGEIIPLRERATALGRQIILNFYPSFYLTSLDPQTARDVIREVVAPEMVDMLRAKILLPEFQDALRIK